MTNINNLIWAGHISIINILWDDMHKLEQENKFR